MGGFVLAESNWTAETFLWSNNLIFHLLVVAIVQYFANEIHIFVKPDCFISRSDFSVNKYRWKVSLLTGNRSVTHIWIPTHELTTSNVQKTNKNKLNAHSTVTKLVNIVAMMALDKGSFLFVCFIISVGEQVPR